MTKDEKKLYSKHFGSWFEPLREVLEDELPSVFKQLADAKSQGAWILPDKQNVFRAFRECQYDNLKVVVLGQDPYHNLVKGKAVANGMAFSIDVDGYTPPSLRNILSEMNTDIYPMHFDAELLELTPKESWGSRQANQGVLLLNTALTVDKGNAGSHSEIWKSFTEKVIQTIASKEQHIVWILWGNHAKTFKKFIPPHHSIIEGVHPSPLSAYRGFFGSRPFSQANQKLDEHGQQPIKW